MNLNYKFKNQGLTLIEALIWFAIFGAVVTGVFTLYSSSRNANNASTANKELSTIFSQTEQLYAHDDTITLTNKVAIQLGIFPKSLKVDGENIYNVFGGTVEISGQSPSGFTVLYNNVPSGQVCSTMLKAQREVGWDVGRTVSYNNKYVIGKVATTCNNNQGRALSIKFVRANPDV